jgi:hypothetical protein
MVRVDNRLVQACSWTKRKLGLSDALVSGVMAKFQARKAH